MSGTPSFDIAIEWENARFAELDRCRRMLWQLRRDIAAVQSPRAPQVFFLYDPALIDRALVERTVAEEFASEPLPATVRLVATDGVGYHGMKNRAAALSDAEIIVFLDSDTIPEPGWLTALLEPFARPDIRFVFGQTYLDCATLYDKAWSVFWFIHPRNPGAGLRPATTYYANNVAFRRDFLLRHPYPEMPCYRGQGAVHYHRLRQLGFGLNVKLDARVSHPPPNGFQHIVLETLHYGRDEMFIAQATRQEKNLSLRRVAAEGYRWGLGETWHQLRLRRRALALGPWGAAVTLAMGFGYYTLKWIGAMATIVDSDLVPRLFPFEAKAVTAAKRRRAT